MAFLLLLLIFLFPWLIGRSALGILYGKRRKQEVNIPDAFLTGGMIILGLAETAHLGTLFLGRSFSDCVMLFCGMLVLCLMISLGMQIAFYQKKSKRSQKMEANLWHEEKSDNSVKLFFVIFGVLALSQAIYIAVAGDVYRQGDLTVEAVNSFLTSDTLYQVNPLTGQAYEGGMPLRLRILSLPTLYAILCRVTGLSADWVIWTLVPVVTLAGAYCAYFGMSKRLFPNSLRKRGLFLIFAALLLWAGDYMYGMDGFGLLHGGFRGTVIRGLVLLPFTFDLCLRRRWALVILCILAEACMVWTLYGLGACAFAAAGMLVWMKICDKGSGKKNAAEGGKEASKCGTF